MSYQSFYPNGSLEGQPVGTVTLKRGDENGWVSQNGATPVSSPIPAGVYGEIRVTAVRFNFDLTNHLVGFIDGTPSGGASLVPEGQTVVLPGPIDSTTIAFNTQNGLLLQIAADNVVV